MRIAGFLALHREKIGTKLYGYVLAKRYTRKSSATPLLSLSIDFKLLLKRFGTRCLIVTVPAFAFGFSALSDLHFDGPRNRLYFGIVILVNPGLERSRADRVLRAETVAQHDRLSRAD